jgi:fructose-1,6-bisphosphatase/inositol monophosphatase family enzyme
MQNFQNIEEILKECTESCILPYFKNLTENQIETKTSDEDFVTIADRESETYLTDVFTKMTPGCVVLGEEAYAENHDVMKRAAQADNVWIVDPVDGTGNFKDGKDEFCLLLAHVNRGVLDGAWIYAPKLNKFVAWSVGEAVTINGKAVSLDKKEKLLDQMVIGDHIAYGYPDDRKQLVENRQFFHQPRVSLGSFGIETVWMLENRIDALSFARCNPWDIAPCAAMISALGGKALKIDGSAMEKNTLFSRDGAFLACRSPDQWTEIRDAMTKDVEWRKYFV